MKGKKHEGKKKEKGGECGGRGCCVVRKSILAVVTDMFCGTQEQFIVIWYTGRK